MYSDLVLKDLLKPVKEDEAAPAAPAAAAPAKEEPKTAVTDNVIMQKIEQLKGFIDKMLNDNKKLQGIVGTTLASAGAIGTILGAFKLLQNAWASEVGSGLANNWREAVITIVSLICLICGFVLLWARSKQKSEGALNNLIGMREAEEEKRDDALKAKEGFWESVKKMAGNVWRRIKDTVLMPINKFKEAWKVPNWAAIPTAKKWAFISAAVVAVSIPIVYTVFKMRKVATDETMSLWSSVKEASKHFGLSSVIVLVVIVTATGIKMLYDHYKGKDLTAKMKADTQSDKKDEPKQQRTGPTPGEVQAPKEAPAA